MNVKIYKKISNRIKLDKQGKYYIVKTRLNKKQNWIESPSYSSLKKALKHKHNAIQLVIRDLGYFPYFKERRLKKLNKFRRNKYPQK